MFLSLLLSAAFAASTPALSQNNHGFYDIPADSAVLAPLTAKRDLRARVPNTFELLVWNVQKGQGQSFFANDIDHLTRTAEFALLQEGMEDSFMPTVLGGFPEFDFWIARSFFYKLQPVESTGVITGFRSAADSISFRRSPGREPVLSTPKMTLITTHHLESGTPLMMVNIHAINFVTNGTFRDQINDLVPVLKAFEGNIVFAGDFNTWNPGRTKFLQETLSALGFEELLPRRDTRGLRLDHIFVKGCPGSEAWLIEEVSSSDHKPLKATLRCH